MTTICICLLLGCKGAAPALEVTPAPTAEPTPAPTATPVEEKQAVIVAATPEPTAIPQASPTPTPTPTPVPTATPVPTPSPDPYAGQKKVCHRKDDRFFYVTLTDELKARITGMTLLRASPAA